MKVKPCCFEITDECICCAMCVSECPRGAIYENEIYFIDMNKCDCCEKNIEPLCYNVCPVEAVVFCPTSED